MFFSSTEANYQRSDHPGRNRSFTLVFKVFMWVWLVVSEGGEEVKGGGGGG